MKATRFVGLDVHAETINVAVAESGRAATVRSFGVVANDSKPLAKLMKSLGKPSTLQVCYEAGPTGFGLYWQLHEMGIDCTVVAPTLIPKKSGDKVKTDRRDAEKLARLHRAGELTPVNVPDMAHEALRDLVRARAAAVKDMTRHRNRIGKFLLRQGRRMPEGMTAWGARHMTWLREQEWSENAHRIVFDDLFAEVEHARDRVQRLERALEDAIQSAPEHLKDLVTALQALRGVKLVTAATVATELVWVSRFESARKLMAYSAWYRASVQRAGRDEPTEAASPRPATLTYGACWSKPRGTTDTARRYRRIWHCGARRRASP
jgi:transposase